MRRDSNLRDGEWKVMGAGSDMTAKRERRKNYNTALKPSDDLCSLMLQPSRPRTLFLIYFVSIRF